MLMAVIIAFTLQLRENLELFQILLRWKREIYGDDAIHLFVMLFCVMTNSYLLK